MKKTKWQGIACLFLASLMMGSSFAAPVAPKTPERGAAPTKQEAPTQVEPTKPAQPVQPTQPTQPVQPVQPTNPTQSTPATEKKAAPADGEKKASGQDEKEKKPFALDHFKMIVCSLKQLGMEDQQIAASIKQGKKLEDILKENKISAKKFKRCMMKQYSKAVDVGVKEGQLTKEQAKQLKVALKETVDKWLPKK